MLSSLMMATLGLMGAVLVRIASSLQDVLSSLGILIPDNSLNAFLAMTLSGFLSILGIVYRPPILDLSSVVFMVISVISLARIMLQTSVGTSLAKIISLLMIVGALQIFLGIYNMAEKSMIKFSRRG